MRSADRYSRNLVLCALVASVMFSPLSAAASEQTRFSNKKVVQLRSGITYIDFDGDAVMDMVIKSRTYYSSPSANYWVYRFLLRRGGPGSTEATWAIVPVEKSYESTHDDWITSSEGPDCILRDIRLLTDEQSKESPVTLILADRDDGLSEDDEERVRFFIFRFDRDPNRVPGWPQDYFRMVDIIEGKSRYCDINEAFRKELGIE